MAESFTNQAREQAESKSSFFKREKILGAFRTRRSKITGSKFKKGTSQESADNIKKRVDTNEKKITLLKKIVKLRKQNVDKKMGEGALLESLQSIASTVDSIRDTLIKQQDNDKRTAEDLRREKEEDERKGQEKGLESSKPNILQKVGDVVMKPVMGLFGRIFNFLKTLFLGKILMNFIDWFSNPANQGKIQTLVRFVKDWWPALTAAVLLFGTGFGGLVAGLIKTIMWFIPAMGKAIVALKSAKFMSMIPGKGKIGAIAKVAGPLLIGGGIGYGIGRMQGGEEEQPQGFNKGGQVPGSGPNKDTVPAMLTPGEFVMSRGAVEEYGVDTLEGMNAAAGGTNRPTLMGGYKGGGFAKRGVVTDPKERQQQEAYMLKFVNEERALQGLPPLINLTYAPGVELTKAIGPGPRIEEQSNTVTDLDRGITTKTKSRTVDGKTEIIGKIGQSTDEEREKFFTENPHAQALLDIKNQAELDNLGADISASARMNGGGLVQGFQGGGLVTVKPGTINSYQDAIDAGIQVEDIVTGSGRFGGIRWKEKAGRGFFGLGKQRYQVKGTQWNLSGTGGAIEKELAMSTEDYVNMKMGWSGASSAKVKSIKPKSIKPKDSSKSGGSSGILGPISSNVDAMVNTDKYKVQPKPNEKKNTVVAYQQALDEQQQQSQEARSDGNEIPSFTLRPDFMVDEAKLDVLGIVI